MAYQIYKFDDATLPLYNSNQIHDPGQLPPSLAQSVGGSFDIVGDYQRKPNMNQISIRGYVIGQQSYEVDESGNYIVDESGNYIVTHGAAVDLLVKVEAIQKRIDLRSTLWRRLLSSTTTMQWKTARLSRAEYVLDYEDGDTEAELSCVFETRMAGWHAETETTDTATFTASGLQQLDVDNGGEMRVDDAEIVITSGTGGYTSVRVQCADTGVDWTFTGGTAATGATRTIDCDVGTIRSGSDVDMYEYFTLNSGHTARGWLPLKVGNNQLIITMVGAGTVVVNHYGQYP